MEKNPGMFSSKTLIGLWNGIRLIYQQAIIIHIIQNILVFESLGSVRLKYIF